jgi:hypothetical protein
MGAYTLHTCSICDAPIQVNGGFTHGSPGSNPQKAYRRLEAVHLDMGYSRGGWGRRQQWLTFSSGCVCGECFDQIEALVHPLEQFVRGGKRRDPVQPMPDQEPSPSGRGTSLLRSVRALLPMKS